jgi:aminodeoxyfutalosine synthase
MTSATHVLSDLETKAAAGQSLTAQEAERMVATVDLVSVGVVGESARRAVSADVVTFGRVLELTPIHSPALRVTPDATLAAVAGEVRITGVPLTADQAIGAVRQVTASMKGCRTGYSLADLWALSGGDAVRLAQLAAGLVAAGLDAVAELPIDRFSDVDQAAAAVEGATRGGLGVWRMTVHEAGAAVRLDLILRAAELQRRVSCLRAFAPLPRLDPAGEPSTGYDDVRTVAVARAVCLNIPHIQVDWPLYGPKLAQVAIAFGANDIDGIAVTDQPDLGPRRGAVEDILRQIRAAAAVPAERDGRYERRK